MLVERLNALADQLSGVELHLVHGLVVDSAPEFLKLLLGEVRLVEWDHLRLAAVRGHRYVDVQRVDEFGDLVVELLQAGRHLGHVDVGPVMPLVGEVLLVVDEAVEGQPVLELLGLIERDLDLVP